MSKFIIPFSGELRVEAETVEKAQEIAYAFREFMMASLKGRLPELNLEKVSMKPMPEITEVDEAWLENNKFRPKFRKEWGYLTHRIAVKALPETIEESTDKSNS